MYPIFKCFIYLYYILNSKFPRLWIGKIVEYTIAKLIEIYDFEYYVDWYRNRLNTSLCHAIKESIFYYDKNDNKI